MVVVGPAVKPGRVLVVRVPVLRHLRVRLRERVGPLLRVRDLLALVEVGLLVASRHRGAVRRGVEPAATAATTRVVASAAAGVVAAAAEDTAAAVEEMACVPVGLTAVAVEEMAGVTVGGDVAEVALAGAAVSSHLPELRGRLRLSGEVHVAVGLLLVVLLLLLLLVVLLLLLVLLLPLLLLLLLLLLLVAVVLLLLLVVVLLLLLLLLLLAGLHGGERVLLGSAEEAGPSDQVGLGVLLVPDSGGGGGVELRARGVGGVEALEDRREGRSEGVLHAVHAELLRRLTGRARCNR